MRRILTHPLITTLLVGVIFLLMVLNIIRVVETPRNTVEGTGPMIPNSSQLVLGADIAEFTKVLGVPKIEKDDLYKGDVHWYDYMPYVDHTIDVKGTVYLYTWLVQTSPGADGKQRAISITYKMSLTDQLQNKSLPKGFCSRFIRGNSQLVRASKDKDSGVYKSDSLVGVFSSLPFVANKEDMANGVYEVASGYNYIHKAYHLFSCRSDIGNNYIKS